MLRVVFTLDYEIHGNGDGCPNRLMVEPTRRMMDLFERYGAKLTIMADVAEILKFKEYKETKGSDDYCYEAIAEQLREAIRRGHDVQLHLHSSYFNARYQQGKWLQDWSDYNFAGLNPERMTRMIQAGKHFLESLLQPIDPGYSCLAFRAANWSVSPSKNVVRALVDNDFKIDTSVFKYGRREGMVNFDYSDAHSALEPWLAAEDDICRQDNTGKLIEVPIYSERRWIGAFLTLSRIARAISGRAHRLSNDNPKTAVSGHASDSRLKRCLRKILVPFRLHAWKADFNQCTGRQLVRGLERAEKSRRPLIDEAPFVLIGHSKLFTESNERSLRPFLEFCASSPERVGFGTLTSLHSGLLEKQDGKTMNSTLPGACVAGPNSARAMSYVLVTPARNEAGTIAQTIESVISQTVVPREWVIVSNGCTDQTDEIVLKYAKAHPFIRLVHWEDHARRNFASVVFATEAGVRALACHEYDYLGLLDSDVRFGAIYFETLMARMSCEPRLGIAGGLVLDVVNGQRVWHRQLITEVPGAVQFYRRGCFESLSGLTPMPEGGWDVITCLEARANGYKTRTFEDIIVEHLKPRNSSEGGRLRRAWKWGLRDYGLGYHPVFEFGKCVVRAGEAPLLVAAGARWAGFLWGYLAGPKRRVPDALVLLLRKEQWQRAGVFGKGGSSGVFARKANPGSV